MYSILLVEDDADLLKSNKMLMNNIFSFAKVICCEDYHMAKAYLLQTKAAGCVLPDICLLDINLEEHVLVKRIDKTYTAWDGIRLWGFICKVLGPIPCVLYTGHDPSSVGLDEFDCAEAPFWVVEKAGGGIDIIVDVFKRQFCQVAERLLREIQMSDVMAVLSVLQSGSTPGTVSVGNREWDWNTLLGPIRTLFQMDSDLEVLRLMTPVNQKMATLTRWFKPGDYKWISARQYGLPGTTPFDGHSAMGRCTHPVNDWNASGASIPLEKIAVDEARRQLGLLSSILLPARVKSAEKYIQLATGWSDERKDVDSETASEFKSKWEANVLAWLTALENSMSLSLDKSSLPIYIQQSRFYAEYGEIISALTKLVSSAKENSGGTCVEVKIALESNDTESFDVALYIVDNGTGWPDGDQPKNAFLHGSDIRPADNTTGRGHALKWAQGLLWGYCEWQVLTKRNGNCFCWDVYRDTDQLPEAVLRVMHSHINNTTGSVHRCLFRFPKQIGGPCDGH